MDLNSKQEKGAPSLIGRDESTAIKGFVMILIMIGHCHLLADYHGANGQLLHYNYWKILYSFHVCAFLILPFVYGSKPLAGPKDILSKLKTDAIRMYVPYIWFFLLCIATNWAMTHHTNIPDALKAFILGANQKLWNESINAQFLWFMPTMVVVLLLRNIFFNCSRVLQIALIVLAFFIAVPFDSFSHTVRRWTPLAIMNGVFFLWPAVVARWFLQKKAIANQPVLWTVAFAILVVFHYVDLTQGNVVFHYIRRALIAAAFFMMVYSYRKWLVKSKLLMLIGKYSFQIYLIHLFVYGILAKVMPHGQQLGRIDIGIIQLVLTIIISTAISIAIMKIPLVKKYVFPRG